MSFFPTKEQTLADDLLDSIDAGGIDLSDAVIAALKADGLDATQCQHIITLAYRVRARSQER